MKSFFLSSYYFWIVSRIIFCIALLFSLVSIFQEGHLSSIELLVNLIAVAYLIVLIVIILRQLSGALRFRFARSFVGVISLLIGTALIIVPFITSVISIPAILLFAFWMLGLGMFDLLCIHRASTIEEES